jgi:hypothetical protein
MAKDRYYLNIVKISMQAKVEFAAGHGRPRNRSIALLLVVLWDWFQHIIPHHVSESKANHNDYYSPNRITLIADALQRYMDVLYDVMAKKGGCYQIIIW